MTPTIVLKDGQPVLVTGSPGGSRIERDHQMTMKPIIIDIIRN
jgi:gamma-glutamyltranspeptidase